MLPLVFLVGLLFGLKRWPAVLVFVLAWPLVVLFFTDDPPRRMVEFWLVVVGNAAAGVAAHEAAAALRWVVYSVFRTLFDRRQVGTGV
jgi:hypothetical protein